MILHAHMRKLPSQGQPSIACTTGMPPPRLPPRPRPVIAPAALRPPVKAARPFAAAHAAKVLQPAIVQGNVPIFPAWQVSSTQQGAGCQQGGQNAAKQALLQPAATAHIQLVSSVNPADPKAFKGGKRSKQDAQGHAQGQVSNSGLAQSMPRAGVRQPSGEHAASAAPAQSAVSQLKGSEQAAAAAARAPQWPSREFAISCMTASLSLALCSWQYGWQCAAWAHFQVLLQLRAETTAGLLHFTSAFHNES